MLLDFFFYWVSIENLKKKKKREKKSKIVHELRKLSWKSSKLILQLQTEGAENCLPLICTFCYFPIFFSNSSKLCGCGGALQLEDNTDHWFCPLTLHNDLCISQTYCHDNSLYCFHATALLVMLLIAKGTSPRRSIFTFFCCNFFFSGCK